MIKKKRGFEEMLRRRAAEKARREHLALTILHRLPVESRDSPLLHEPIYDCGFDEFLLPCKRIGSPLSDGIGKTDSIEDVERVVTDILRRERVAVVDGERYLCIVWSDGGDRKEPGGQVLLIIRTGELEWFCFKWLAGVRHSARLADPNFMIEDLDKDPFLWRRLLEVSRPVRQAIPQYWECYRECIHRRRGIAFAVARNLPVRGAVQVTIETNETHTVILAREHSIIIKSMKKKRTNEVSFVQGLFDVDGVLVICTLFSWAKDDIYEVWWNLCNDEHRLCASYMAKQDFLGFLLIGDSRDIEYAIYTNNGAQEFFKQAIQLMQNRNDWSMADFESARNRIYAQYPTPKDLWDKIEGGSSVKKYPKGGRA